MRNDQGGVEIPERLLPVVKQLQAELDYAAEMGNDLVEVGFDDLNKLISWLAGDPS